MLLTPCNLNSPMLSGDVREFHGYRFAIPTAAGMYPVFVHVHPQHGGMCSVCDYRTGLRVSVEHTPDPKQAALGFADMVAVGALDWRHIMEAARAFPTLNPTTHQELATA
jgi:hypothetical protein